jgi:cytochrome b561
VLPTTLKPYERVLANVTHFGLYLLLFAMPLTGWMMTSARGFPVSWFGFFQLPDFVPKNDALYNAMKETHDTLALALYAIVALHVAAALKHHFVLKDDVLRRMLPMFATSIFTVGLASGTGAARAADAAPPMRYTLDQTKSALEFQFMQAGAQNKGKFTRFPVTLDFSPDNLAASKLDVVVEMASLDTGDKERDDTLKGADLFSVAKFPQAHFTSTQITRTAAGYDAAGKLTLRGVTRDIHVPFTFKSTDEQGKPAAYLAGRTTIKRLDFGVGQGDWKSTEWVGNDVAVAYSLRLLPAGH